MAQMLRIPKGVPIARAQPRPLVQIPEGVQELPLIDKDMPPERHVQEVWRAHVRTFNLSEDAQREEYERVWQRITDGHAVSCESRVEFHDGKFLALLRWADFEYKLPQQV